MTPEDLDQTDRLILMHLQQDGRISNQELAQRVDLSPSPCLRRVKRLEEQGYIRRYVALADPDRLGLGLLAYISVRLDKSHRAEHSAISGFVQDVQGWPEVTQCYAMSGDMDYLLRVQVSDLSAFSRFAMDTLLRHPAVIDIRSSFALQSIKETTELPVSQA
ncbi:Lrp/AsnC family transcriptional regulator [uncultured Castellaniella sp.]|jgi:Lrp/AsnC family leucine-responsive transcriptional regulator|uniref:Lrp/AsnC family transcriptional regulator n=1 Tax=uncultured Castellaniella sp. TaxID=647907 RepID=UPI00261FDEB2|nr:Lrp/AsnC family transcriptional regulator [uncultured Castellaniella sp.]